MAELITISAPTEQTEGTEMVVGTWFKKVGDPVTENEPLLEISTDKVTVEVAAPATGILREILKGADQPIQAGELGLDPLGDCCAGFSRWTRRTRRWHLTRLELFDYLLPDLAIVMEGLSGVERFQIEVARFECRIMAGHAALLNEREHIFRFRCESRYSSRRPHKYGESERHVSKERTPSGARR